MIRAIALALTLYAAANGPAPVRCERVRATPERAYLSAYASGVLYGWTSCACWPDSPLGAR